MIEMLKLYLPHVKRKVTLELAIPKTNDQPMDTLYFLDGQNAFLDQSATFHRSIRAEKYLRQISRHTNRPILGVGIYNAGSDLGRINEYTPFPLTGPVKAKWKKQNNAIFHAFCDDLMNTIIPEIEKRFNTSTHRFIYGSSLAALTALYLGYQYDLFEGIGAFSTASFLCPEEMTSFIKERFKPQIKLFLYVGEKEVSDDLYDATLYYRTTKELYQFILQLGGTPRLIVSQKGTHCEASWEKQLLDFFSFLYEEQIIYRL